MIVTASVNDTNKYNRMINIFKNLDEYSKFEILYMIEEHVFDPDLIMNLIRCFEFNESEIKAIINCDPMHGWFLTELIRDYNLKYTKDEMMDVINRLNVPLFDLIDGVNNGEFEFNWHFSSDDIKAIIDGGLLRAFEAYVLIIDSYVTYTKNEIIEKIISGYWNSNLSFLLIDSLIESGRYNFTLDDIIYIVNNFTSSESDLAMDLDIGYRICDLIDIYYDRAIRSECEPSCRILRDDRRDNFDGGNASCVLV